ncbi:DNA polymerase epsilon subunit 2 isoform X2 [Macrosteles quadrilineatus]|uniref:DNA polymerase epsilon subunit 2 isoform X2 n=1 Tax=Macrosteles quadrilineatus TaxID=74068 RepID=UPI0023E22811|nr:DNA polymerase epsilon subunit 2 isoform X2 [Macrosteles quadrilineatus]
MSDLSSAKKFILTSFKFNGLSIRSDACEYFASQLAPLEEQERDEWLDKVVDYIQRQSLNTPFVEKGLIESAILDCCKSETEENITILNVISAFEIPHFIYNIDRKKFLPQPTKQLDLFGSPDSKCHMFRERYTVLKQRTLRHELFSVGQQFQLQPVEYLLSHGGNINRVIVLGMLTQLKENRFYIEDPSGCVPLDLSQTNYHTGFFTESSFVLVEGNYKDKILHVQALGFPPPENAEISRIYFGCNNIFGGLDELNVKSSEKLKKIEESNSEAMIIFISDIWLDQHKVVEKLKVLFGGYDDFPPTAMVLMGNFLSSKEGSQLSSMLKAKMKQLADLLAQYRNLITNTKIIIVPGPADCLAANILPRPAFISYITEDLKKQIPNIEFATNPCRIQYCTQEIVVIREDIVTKLCRNCVHFPTTDDIPDHFAKTVVAQAHLAPLPPCVCPVYWDHDHALRLYPLPDLVVVADQMKAFTTSHMNCSIINPGSFSKGEFGFKVYYPSSKTVEDSQIPEDND